MNYLEQKTFLLVIVTKNTPILKYYYDYISLNRYCYKTSQVIPRMDVSPIRGIMAASYLYL